MIPATGGKLGSRVAAAMRDDIERRGWPVGTVLGAEAELRERYGVSRAVLREAVRILEYHGAVTTKRGPGGGVVIARPDGQSIVRAAELALGYEAVTLEHLLEVRAALEVEAVRRVAASCSGTTAAELWAAVDEEPEDLHDVGTYHEVHRRLAQLSGSRPLALFVDVVTELTTDHVPKAKWRPEDLPRISAEVQRAHAGIVGAVVDGDVAAAERRMVRHLQATIATLE